MYHCLLVLIDESDFLMKAEALRTLALLMAQTDAPYRGMSRDTDPAAYDAFVFSRADELAAKLHQAMPMVMP